MNLFDVFRRSKKASASAGLGLPGEKPEDVDA